MPRTYWIGGGTGGGKSTVSRQLAAEHGLRRFPIDAFWYAYEGDTPRKTPDEQWLRTPPEEQAREFEEVSRRMHLRVLADLAVLPQMPTLVEGPQVQPDLIPRGERAVFLVGTPEFQRAVLEPRPMPSSDPALALRHRLVKDRIYADRIADRARELGFPVIDVDGTRDLVAAHRWENEMVARNRRAWIASGDHRVSSAFAFTWVCECGQLGCEATLKLTLDEYEAGAVRSAH